MATVIPAGWRELAALATAGSAQRELATLAVLADGLPDDCTVYHGLHWTRVQAGAGHAVVGGIDFAVLGPSGRLLLIEQKSGFLAETPEGLCATYAKKEKSVPLQIGRSMEALRQRLAALSPGQPFRLEALLYCPDYTVRQPGSAGIAPERIVDAPRRAQLLPTVRALVAPDADEAPHPALAKLRRFLADQLQLVPEVGAIAGQAGTLYTRLSGGLAHWARQIECQPFRLRVVGTAGSGKTQLALAVFADALAAGRRPLYVCYNRPLADHMARLVPPGGEVATYHQLADRLSRAAGQVPDFSTPGAFVRLEAFFDACQPSAAWLFDELIVDEGQDFQAPWKDNLLRLLRPDGRAWWLEDPLQNLYGRPPIELPGWVVLRSQTNYRSPQDVLGRLNALLGGLAASAPAGAGGAEGVPAISAGSPLSGSAVEVFVYDDDAGLVAQTKRAITAGLSAGFRRDMMLLLTYRGREHSQLTPYDHLGAYPLRAFSGRYDLFGNPEYSEGELLIDSVYRFKGQSAPCVIFTEIDFAALDETAARKLFVGMTRATMKLILVVSTAAQAALDGVEGG